MTRLLRGALLLVLGGLGLVLGFLGLALVGALIPRNSEFHSSDSGVTIWVACSEIHTDIVVPAKDWNGWLLPPCKGDFPYLAVGWGDRRFYLETPTWADLKWRNVATAMCGVDATAMHVDWLQGELEMSPRVRRLTLRLDQYEHLCQALRQGFQQDSGFRPIPIPAAGYTPHDRFYEGLGNYNLFHTCNSWAGDTLAAAGVRVGSWTPFPWGVLWQIPEL